MKAGVTTSVIAHAALLIARARGTERGQAARTRSGRVDRGRAGADLGGHQHPHGLARFDSGRDGDAGGRRDRERRPSSRSPPATPTEDQVTPTETADGDAGAGGQHGARARPRTGGRARTDARTESTPPPEPAPQSSPSRPPSKKRRRPKSCAEVPAEDADREPAAAPMPMMRPAALNTRPGAQEARRDQGRRGQARRPRRRPRPRRRQAGAEGQPTRRPRRPTRSQR